MNNERYKLYTKDSIEINVEQWHKLFNLTNFPLKIVEIQYGNECVEEDIERESAYC